MALDTMSKGVISILFIFIKIIQCKIKENNYF